jgi:hypothetical protein
VTIEGDTIVVGSTLESSNTTGVNGDQSNTSMAGAGAAYVFTRTGSTWTQQAYLKASTASNMNFGSAVSISGDSLAVGAFGELSNATGINGNQNDVSAGGAGAVYLFTRAGSTWTQQAYIKPSNTRHAFFFGYTVALDKDTLAVGATGETSTATGINGNQADASAIGAGAVYVFTRAGTTWSQQAYVKSSNTQVAGQAFGAGLALRGDLLAVGAPAETSKATGINGDQKDTSLLGAGAVYLFSRTGTTWQQLAYVKPTNTATDADYGQGLSLSADSLAIGSYREPSAATGLNGNQSDKSISGAGAVYVVR